VTVLLSRVSAAMFTVSGVLLVIAQTHSVPLAGVTAAAAVLPGAVAGPILGAWLDVTRSRRVLIALDQVLSAAGLVALLALAGHAPDWTLPAVGVIYSVTRPFSSGSFVSALPELAGAELIATASSLEAFSVNFSTVIGPALAGVLAAVAGAGATIGIQAGLSVIVAALVALNPAFEVRPAERSQRISTALSAGLHALGSDRVLRATGLASACANFGWGLMIVGYPIYAERSLHASTSAGGYLWAGVSVGSILGTLAVRGNAKLARIAISYALLSASALLWLAAHNLVLGIAVVAITGVVEGPAFSHSVVIRQLRPPSAVRAQVISTMSSITLAATALGSAAAGSLHDPSTIILLFVTVNALAAITATIGHLQKQSPAQRPVAS
jgi:predicted MFS family arabinose efflux permease